MEQNSVMGPVGMVGGAIGFFLVGWVMYICAACIVLAVHRHGILAKRPRWIQIASYAALSIALVIGVSRLNREIRDQQVLANRALARTIASMIPKPTPADTSKADRRPIVASKTPVPPPRTVTKPLQTNTSHCASTGDDAYTYCSDAQLGQWAIDEADQIARLANSRLVSEGGPEARRFYFNDKFQECCATQVKGLRSVILKRLGPAGEDLDESSTWTALFPETKYPDMPKHEVNASLAKDYARYLRRMGLALKRREIPRSPTMHLKFALQKLPPGSLPVGTIFNYEYSVELTPPKELDAGYIVVEFDQGMGYMSTDFQTSQAVFNDIENKAVVTIMAQARGRVFVLQISNNPFVPEAPIHVFAAANRPLSVVGAYWFDE
jgi:hypothetical protein